MEIKIVCAVLKKESQITESNKKDKFVSITWVKYCKGCYLFSMKRFNLTVSVLL